MQLGTGLVFTFFNRTSATNLALSVIVSGLLTVTILFLMGMISHKTLKANTIRWRHIPLAIAGALLCIVATDLASELMNLPDLMKQEFTELAHNIWGMFALVVVGPLVEELVFREAIIRHLLRHQVHRRTAILVSALLFALIHFNPIQIPFAFAMGIVLAIIYVKMGNILITTLIHISNNALGVLELRYMGEGPDPVSYTELLGGPVFTMAYTLICAMLCIVFMRRFWEKYHRKHGRDVRGYKN